MHLGMALGEALARCPSLRLIPADPARAAERWEGLLGRLEGIGAAVESERAGEAFFAVDGLLALHGGEPAGVMSAARGAARAPVRIAAAPNRFAAFLAASRGSRLPRSVGAKKGGRASGAAHALLRAMSAARQLNAPRPAAVTAAVGGAPVEATREDWVVGDRRWTARPQHRLYYELVLAGGRNTVVFCDLTTRRWYRQRT